MREIIGVTYDCSGCISRPKVEGVGDEALGPVDASVFKHGVKLSTSGPDEGKLPLSFLFPPGFADDG